jgi:UDP-N-acetylmuramate--alanine ligase
MSKIKIGIFFGGRSREREVSFAGGRTVYDNLDKSLFEPIPIFVDSFGQFILCDWEYIYKGSIRDFYPPVDYLPELPEKFQVYAESLSLTTSQKKEMVTQIGKLISPEDFSSHFDVAFLALHGSYGEDGTIQGILEWYDIPYTGSGILGSAIGINKLIQKRFAANASNEFNMLHCERVELEQWESNKENQQAFYQQVKALIGYPLIVKAANQGSSIGITILKEDDFENFVKAVEFAFFRLTIKSVDWFQKSNESKWEFLQELCDIRTGMGLPVVSGDILISNPQDLFDFLERELKAQQSLLLTPYEGENTVIVEPFVEGREFSCIVIKTEDNRCIALPPTEIIKTDKFFDYRSKYLPGLSRKVTPMKVEGDVLEQIRTQCSRLMNYFDFRVYARIDGFYTHKGEIFLNDPNTTSGMMPSSFFFHQAAEIGLNPSEFITYIIQTSLKERARTRGVNSIAKELDKQLELLLNKASTALVAGEKIAVILGGDSFERHISVESGRNIYEKLVSSGKYDVVPLFLLKGTGNDYRFFHIPVNILLKDNADDIRDKLLNYQVSDEIEKIRKEFQCVTGKYLKGAPQFIPEEWTWDDLEQRVYGVFLALHGRPGEDGTLQKELLKRGIYFNGSGPESSMLTIDKYETIKKLREAGFKVTGHFLADKLTYLSDSEKLIKQIEEQLGFPLILKPHDDGCSAAVNKIKNREGLKHYANLIFRLGEKEENEARAYFNLNADEEFPNKNCFLAEKLISPEGAKHFLEITGGMLTKKVGNELVFEVFEPSEALAEGEILSLEEKFLAGQGQNITPARFSKDPEEQQAISAIVKSELEKVARVLDVEGYCRIDAFVRIYEGLKVELIVIEVNSLPGMTPATCIYHQASINGYKPFDFIDKILEYGRQKIHKEVSS